MNIVQYNANALLSDYHMFVQYNMLWGKLFPISLFYNVKFPVELNMVYFEDGATTFKLIYEAKEVRYSPEQLYYTVGKADSMTRKPITEKRIKDSLLSSEAPVLFYSGKGETQLEKCAYVQYMQTIISILEICLYDGNAKIDRKYYWNYGRKLYQKCYFKAMGAPGVRLVKKIQYFIILINPHLYFNIKHIRI